MSLTLPPNPLAFMAICHCHGYLLARRSESAQERCLLAPSNVRLAHAKRASSFVRDLRSNDPLSICSRSGMQRGQFSERVEADAGKADGVLDRTAERCGRR